MDGWIMGEWHILPLFTISQAFAGFRPILVKNGHSVFLEVRIEVGPIKKR